ncbi:MAG: carboxypeptidase-like regulatory domain-containing protein, partial [Acidobacteriota bacterium]
MRAVTSRFYEIGIRFACLALIAVVGATMAFAQTQATAADLSGSVTDPSGAVVSGATITARNSATGITRTVTANAQGSYQFIGLPPGEYEISAEAATFKKVVISGVRLTVGQAAELTIKLELGE